MTYAAPPVPTTPPPAAAPRRPITVRFAAVLLVVMAVAGLGYSVATLAVTPGVVDRFRDASSGIQGDADSFVTVLWLLATVGTVLSVILFALYVVLAIGVLRGSQGFRVATWVVCGLGVLFGCGAAVTVATQRAGDGTPGTLGHALSESYPDLWIETNVGLALAQMLGYVVVAVLLMASNGFFRQGRSTAAAPGRQPTYVALPTYGSQQPYAAPQQPAATLPAAPAPTPEEHAVWARPTPEQAPPRETPADGAVPSTETSRDGHPPHSPS
jgi:hypothetical protein